MDQIIHQIIQISLLERLNQIRILGRQLDSPTASAAGARIDIENPAFALLPLEDHLDYPFDRWIVGPGAWRIFPAAEHDGFTVHALVRRG